MTITELIENTVSVAGKPIFVVETGSGPAVVMLHGGGPGASGVSNYSRNIDALAQHFRVIVPDCPVTVAPSKVLTSPARSDTRPLWSAVYSMSSASMPRTWSATPTAALRLALDN